MTNPIETPAKPTPTPWIVARAEQADGTVLVWIDALEGPSEGVADLYHRIESTDRFFVKSNAAANAAFIVQACNAHADLVAALRIAIDSLEYVQRTHPGLSGYGVRQERITAARAALAYAEVQP